MDANSTHWLQGTLANTTIEGVEYEADVTLSGTNTGGVFERVFDAGSASRDVFGNPASGQVFPFNSITGSVYGVFIENATGQNFTSNTFSRNTEDIRVENSPGINFLGILQNQKRFSNGLSNLSFSQLVIKAVSKINYSNLVVVAKALNTSRDVHVGSDFVSVNSSGSPGLNASARVALQVPDCTNFLHYFYENFTTNAADVFAYGQPCNAPTTPACTSISCAGGAADFSAAKFSSYSGAPSPTPTPPPPNATAVILDCPPVVFYANG